MLLGPAGPEAHSGMRRGLRQPSEARCSSRRDTPSGSRDGHDDAWVGAVVAFVVGTRFYLLRGVVRGRVWLFALYLVPLGIGTIVWGAVQNDHAHAVIMAGGAGTRFWPLWRRAHPKHFRDQVAAP